MGVRGLLLTACLAAGCSSPDLPMLPAEPEVAEPEVPPPPDAMVIAPTDPGALTPGREGDAILPGVTLHEPLLDVATGTATFSVRNDSGRDLPDLILAVVFAVPPADGKGPVVPRFESVEAPLRSGETRPFRATLAALRGGEAPASFRVVPGLPEVLTAGGEGMPGTTFLGGLVECVSLEADLTGPKRQVTVGLAPRGAAEAAPLPPLEAQLLIGRAGELRWTGPWILVSRERRIQWNLDDAPGLAGCELFLRIREKR
jgi:hypothetical protein